MLSSAEGGDEFRESVARVEQSLKRYDRNPVMPHEITAGQMLDAFKADAPGHVSGTRWAHTHGIGVVGHFVASDVARHYCIADHFQGHTVPVFIRLSNGSSEPVRHDERPDTRGL